jgi:hypothetical protein
MKKGYYITMKNFENLLVGMDPLIRAYHQGRWVTRDTPPRCAEDLYREWKRRKRL